MRSRNMLLGAVLVFGCVLLLRNHVTGLQAPLSSIDHPEANAVIKLEFGLTAKTAQEWEGTITASAGEILSTWGWHFVLPDRIIGRNGWSFRTRLLADPNEKYRGVINWHQESLPDDFTVLPNGVFVTVRAPDSAVFEVRTNRGDFSVALGELRAAGRLSFLAGEVAAVYTPPVRPLTRGEASQHDFPSAAARGDDLFVAWVTYHNEANLLYLAHRREGVWKTHRVTPSWGDYYGSAVTVDRQGRVYVAWSEYRADRWRLLSRRYDPAADRWDSEQYVAPSGRRQFFHRMTSDAAGNPWMVWQEFSGDSYDIYAARHDGERWSGPLRVSASPSNDWHPAVAAAPDGAVWVAWDGYEAGHYDIYLRSIRDGTLGPIIRVTQSETYDANVTLAVDPQNRVWLAWEEAGVDWGKDVGVLVRKGSALHETRRIRLAAYAAGKFTEPARPLEHTVPPWLGALHEFPQLAIGPNGLPYIFFRHYLFRMPMPQFELEMRFGSEARTLQPWYDTAIPLWDIFVTGFDGRDWLPVRQLPESTGRCRMQTASALTGDELVYVWPVDGRSYADPHVKSAQLRYAEFAISDAPAAEPAMKPFVSEPSGDAGAAPTEARDLERIRAARWDDQEPLRLFRGDLHRHTDISADAVLDGALLTTYRYAIDAAALDFLAVTDHTGHEKFNYYQYDWWRNRQVATLFNNPGVFATFFGYERTVTYPGGHRNIISLRRKMKPFRISDEEFYGVESYGDRLFPHLKKFGDIAIPHTTATGMGTDWREDDPAAEPVVEIFQGARGSYEEPNSPGKAGASEPAGFVWNAWKLGRRIGVITSSDHYSTHQSYACVYAPELTAESIHKGIKHRRTYGATDNIVLKFEALGPDGRSYKMGEELRAASPPELRIEIDGTDSLEKVELIRNGRILLTRQPGQSSLAFSYRDNSPPQGTAYYHVRVLQANGQIAWSSPIWVDPED